jgi:uncharacterized membrane protein
MAESGTGRGIDSNTAISVAVYAELVYTVISASCSSPQTTEINAKARSSTLMKWVNIGLLQGAGFGILGACLDKRRWPPLVGSGIAMGLLWAQYRHALTAGLASTEPGTEDYGTTPRRR